MLESKGSQIPIPKMTQRWHLLVCALASLCLISMVASDDPEFPKLNELEVMAYTTEVQVTDVIQQDTGYATELYQVLDKVGKLYLLVGGEIKQIHYFNETNQVILVNATRCMVWGIDETDYGLEDIFYGWHHPDPLVIGPSALLFYAQDRRNDIKYEGKEQVRGIPDCDKFSLDIINAQENVTVYYYFAPQSWTTPYQTEKLRVPIRIHVRGQSSKNVEGKRWIDVEVVNDFAYFKPSIDDETELQPPVELGCKLKTKTDRFPDIPKAFQYSAELVDLLDASEHESTDVRFERVWYDSERRLGRFDIFKKTSSLRSFQDYNTGVMFNYNNGQNCKVEALTNAFFEKYGSGLEGSFKEPNEVLYLNGDFYEMGQREVRGLTCDTFESVEYDYEYEFTTYHRFVVTAYFVEDYAKIGVDSEMETRIPLQITLTGWKDAKTMAFKKQYNVLGFNDIVWPEMYAGFEIDKCYKKTNSKSYFIMILNVPANLAAKMEEQNDMIVMELKAQIAKYANIPDWRLPLFQIDYKAIGVYATGLLLERPPALLQFDYSGKDNYKTQDKYLRIADAGTVEDCADACIDGVDCTGFYFCNEACFLKGEDALEPHEGGGDILDLGICDEYLRLERGTTNEHNTRLKKALESLETAVINQNISVAFEIPDGEAVVKVANIVIGEGPYTGTNSADKPYDVNVKFRSLNPDFLTSKAFENVDLLSTCYKKCQEMGSGCSSFSFCRSKDGKSSLGQANCVVSSEFVVRGRTNDLDLIQDENCDIYDLKFLQYFKKYPEQVSFLPGYKDIPYVESAEECAKNCRFDGKTDKEDQQICRGFEFCKSRKLCSLHKKHILDLKPGETGAISGKTPCIHYAARYIADYSNLGTTLVDDTSNVRYQLSLEDCAKICSEDLGDSCKSFNYCPDGPSCELSGKTLSDKGVATNMKDLCIHYEKRNNITDWSKTNENKLAQTGFTKKGFTGLVIGMLALGLIIGALGFAGFSYFKSRQYGEGMSIRFMKQDA